LGLRGDEGAEFIDPRCTPARARLARSGTMRDGATAARDHDLVPALDVVGHLGEPRLGAGERQAGMDETFHVTN
jgi:hypothetical protein